MQVFGRSLMARIIFALIALWLGAGSARAGGGGADAGTLQTLLNTSLCPGLGINPCPQLPTASQLVLELAGLTTAPPDVIRFEGALSTTAAVNAVNPPAGSPIAPTIPAPGSPTAPSNVAPLAFVSGASPAAATQPGEPDANSFFYAATDGAPGRAPTVLNLVYDFPPLTQSSFAKGQTIAELSLPLVILNSDGSETEAPTTIVIQGSSGCGKVTPCVSATATSPSFAGVDPAKLGVTVTLVSQTSANSSTAHAVIRVQAPLVVTFQHDRPYFPGTASATFFSAAFGNDEKGSPSKSLPSTAVGIGIGPVAGPQCPAGGAGGSCGASHFPYCASIANNAGTLQSTVAAFLGIGTVGATYATAPLQSLSGVTCPF